MHETAATSANLELAPWFGKATALAVGTIAMCVSKGKATGSAGTHVATDKFADRIHCVSVTVTARRNKSKTPTDPARARTMLLVRSYKAKEGIEAFHNILKIPGSEDRVAPNRGWNRESKWKLNFLLSSRLVIALGASPDGRKLHHDDSQALHKLSE